jgi:hypothetical protein
LQRLDKSTIGKYHEITAISTVTVNKAELPVNRTADLGHLLILRVSAQIPPNLWGRN